jgi:hypothetical protein
MGHKIRSIVIGFTLLAVAAPAVSQDGGTELYEENARAENLVVRITAPTTEGAGVLFHVDERFAYGITAKHVVFQQGRKVLNLTAHFRSWPGRQLPVEAHKLHHEEDLAVFRADLLPLGLSSAEVLKTLPLDMLGTSATLDPGDALSCLGHSTAGAWLTPKQWVRFARKDGANAFLFEFPCPQGHSGGAVFDKEWRLVGMMIDEERPYCRALGIDPILKIVQGWKLNIDLSSAPSKERGPQEAEKKITVAVVGFDNRSGKEFPDLGAVAQDAATSFLYTLPGVVLVSRDRLDKVRQEIKLPESAQEGTGASHAGRLLNANALLTGSVLSYDVERRTFEGYGTSALQDIFRMEISLQLLDVPTGQVRFSKTFNVERVKEYPKETSAPRESIDRKSELLRALLDLAQNDVRGALMQVAGGLEKAGQFIEVPVFTSPAGADIIVNGLYLGKTPKTLSLTQSSHEIELAMPGYESWHRRIKVQTGMRIDASLAPKLR